MILKETFTKENIERIRKRRKVNPPVLERAIFAMGLLEALRKTNCPFIFKGGSSLMLLLEKPMRLSTDIDILLEPGTDIDHFLTEAAQIFPFVSCQESVRKTAKSIEKRHFRFQYVSLFDSTKTADILLDCVFVKNPYSQLAEREIKNEFLLTEGDNLTVRIPTIEAILGDKLTAFAPHTIGVVFHNEDFSNDKRLEVVKQFYDVSILSGQAKDFNAVRENYFFVAKEELAFRDLKRR